MRPCPVDKLKRALRPLRRAASRMAGAGAPPRAAHRCPVPVRRACSPGRATAQPAPRLCCPRRLVAVNFWTAEGRPTNEALRRSRHEWPPETVEQKKAPKPKPGGRKSRALCTREGESR